MVTTGAEMPILNGIGSAAWAGAAAAPSANARPSEAAVMRSVPDRIASSLELPVVIDRADPPSSRNCDRCGQRCGGCGQPSRPLRSDPDGVFECLETRPAVFSQTAAGPGG